MPVGTDHGQTRPREISVCTRMCQSRALPTMVAFQFNGEPTMNHSIRWCLGVVLVLLSSLQAQAALLVVNGAGQLTGARAVDVDGTLYDVDFRDGTCIELFSGCDDNADFPFTFFGGQQAAQALLDQVFLDIGTPQTAFDSNPSRTYGCQSIVRCIVATPINYQADFDLLTLAAAVNHSIISNANGFPDGTFLLGGVSAAQDFFASLDITFAVWSVSRPPPVPVPVPASWMLALTGLGGLALARRRRPWASPDLRGTGNGRIRPDAA